MHLLAQKEPVKMWVVARLLCDTGSGNCVDQSQEKTYLKTLPHTAPFLYLGLLKNKK